MKSGKSILTALMDEMESLAKENRPGAGNRWVGAVATVLLAVLGAGAAYFLLGPARRRKLQERVSSVSRSSVRRVKSGLTDLGVLHPRRSRRGSRNGTVRSRARRRTTTRVGGR